MTTKSHSNDEVIEEFQTKLNTEISQNGFCYSNPDEGIDVKMTVDWLRALLAQKDNELKQVTAYALNVLKYCEQHPEKIGFYASANPDTITDAVVKGNVDHVGKLVADARREERERIKHIIWNIESTKPTPTNPTSAILWHIDHPELEKEMMEALTNTERHD